MMIKQLEGLIYKISLTLNDAGTTNKLRSIIDYTGAILNDKIDTGGITDDTYSCPYSCSYSDIWGAFRTQRLELILKQNNSGWKSNVYVESQFGPQENENQLHVSCF